MVDAAQAGAEAIQPGSGPAAPSAGALLRQAREAAGLHIGALAASLKVPVAKLEALEADRIDLLPDAVFARALAASVCRSLKIDPAPVLERLPGHDKPKLEIASRLRQSTLQERPMNWGHPFGARAPRSVVILAVLLVVAAVVITLLPSNAVDTLTSSVVMPSARTDTPMAPSPAAAASAVETVSAGAVPAPQVSPVVPAPAAAMAGSPSTAAVVPAGPATPPAPVPVLEQLVSFTARGSSWIQVTDASGQVVLRKTLADGESASAQGSLPLSVVVGKADSTQVTVRGKAFDLAPHARDNVARFQIK